MRKKLVALISMSFVLVLLIAGTARADISGIDVSRWQGTIDWNTVVNQTSFAIIKAGGSDEGFYMDSQFIRNRDEARRLGFARGFYYYAGGGNPVQEAEHFASITGELLPGEVVALDYEIDHPDPAGYSLQFLQRTEQLLGAKPLLYTNMNRAWNNNWKTVADNGNPLWGAIYDDNPVVMPVARDWPWVTMKQYTSSATVQGITANTVDVNVIKTSIDGFELLGKPEKPYGPPDERVTAPAVAGQIPDNDLPPAVDIPANGEADEPVKPVAATQTLSEAKPQSIPATLATEMLMIQFFGSRNKDDMQKVVDFEPKHPVTAVGTVFFSLAGGLFSGASGQPDAVTPAPGDEKNPPQTGEDSSRTEAQAEDPASDSGETTPGPDDGSEDDGESRADPDHEASRTGDSQK